MKSNSMLRFKFKFFVVTALVILAGFHQGRAQATMVTFRVIAFETVSGLENLVFQNGDGQLTKLSLSEMSFSKEYTVLASEGIAFYSQHMDQLPGTEMATGLKPAAYVPIGGNLRELLLVFIPTKSEGGLAYKVWTVPSDNRRFEEGGMMFLNFSGNAMVAEIDNSRVDLASGTPALVPYMGEGQRFNGQVQIAVFIEQSWRRFYSSQWTIPKESKTLIMIYSSPETGLPLLKTVSYRI